MAESVLEKRLYDNVLIDSKLISAVMLLGTLREFDIQIDPASAERHFKGRC